MALRYEYILKLSKDMQNKLSTSLGFGINPWYNRQDNRPLTTLNFPSTHSAIGVRACVVPRLVYQVSPKMFVDLNIPLNPFQYVTRIDVVRNPAYSASQQKRSTFDFEMFPFYYSARLGVGLKL